MSAAKYNPKYSASAVLLVANHLQISPTAAVAMLHLDMNAVKSPDSQKVDGKDGHPCKCAPSEWEFTSVTKSSHKEFVRCSKCKHYWMQVVGRNNGEGLLASPIRPEGRILGFGAHIASARKLFSPSPSSNPV